ncbi:MAG TPA: fumarylacetoacetate hydrolase family protein [Solirubrobacterales bacterium]|nr:fumarylacetoacetate hydrolase family protein [Solirubrobacterales bacterium]
MRLATVRLDGGTRAARVDGETLTLTDHEDVGALLATPGWEQELASFSGPTMALAEADLAPVVPRPEKIIGVGLNYPSHAEEARLSVPDHPPLFAKFWRSLIGPKDEIELPPNSDAPDWEVELAVVIGRPTRHCSEADARDAIAGLTVINDVSMRDWQMRTSEFLQGKTFERTTPFGPWLVTLDEIDDLNSIRMTCELDGVVVQDASTAEMSVSPTKLISYISEFITLVPGDVIATGTPGGVGGAKTPPEFLAPGQTLRTRIEQIGELVNTCVAAGAAASEPARS